MTCIYCGSFVEEIWKLGDLPPSDTFCDTQVKSLKSYCETLAVGVCNSCGLSQNTKLVSEKVRYSDTDYAYSSANSEYAESHWTALIEALVSLNYLSNTSKVLEIGANDGFLLNGIKVCFPQARCIGVDASPYQVEKSNSNYPEIDFKHGVFGKDDNSFGFEIFDLVIANNVVNHSNNLRDFLKCVLEVMRPNGKFVFEVPSLDMMFLNKKWDQIYHEHVSYFSINSLNHILPEAGFNILSMEINEYHGGSLRVICEKTNSFALVEKNSLCTEKDRLRKTALFANRQRSQLIKQVQQIRSISDTKIYCFGAPAKGVTFINFCELDHKMIDACLETSPDKIGKFVPKSGIKIIDQTDVEKGSYIINLLWNIPKVFSQFCIENELEEVRYDYN